MVAQPRAPKDSINERIAMWKMAFDAVHEELRAEAQFASLKLAGADAANIMAGKTQANITTRPIAAQIAADLVKGATLGD